jgi:hypothetical protein
MKQKHLTCEACQDLKGEDFDPDYCESCWPDLWPANYEAMDVYLKCRDQVIMGFDGPVAINHMAIWKYIDEYGINERIETFEKVVALSSAVLAQQRKFEQKSAG